MISGRVCVRWGCFGGLRGRPCESARAALLLQRADHTRDRAAPLVAILASAGRGRWCARPRGGDVGEEKVSRLRRHMARCCERVGVCFLTRGGCVCGCGCGCGVAESVCFSSAG